VKIAYLFSRYPVPSQTFCDTEMRALEQRGCEVEIYSCSPPTTSFRHETAGRPVGPVFYAPPQPGLELGRLAAMRRGVWPAGLIAEHEARFGAQYEPGRRAMHAVAFAERLVRRGVDHLHVHFANRATHAALFIHALTGLPFSFTAHAQDFLVDLGSDALLQEMCAQAAFVVTVSDYSRGALVEKCPAAAGKIRRIYNGLPLDRWPAPLPSAVAGCSHGALSPCPTADALRIFSVGRLIDFKGFDDLITACALLRDRGLAFACEIAGEGPAQLALQAQITALGLLEHVRLLGLLPQTEIRSRLATCDVFALASRTDDKGACDVLPTVILEAMAAGRPVVSTRLAGIPEMILEGENGLLVEPGDPDALAGALANLANDPPLRQRFGRAARARLEAYFSAERASGELAALYTGPASDSSHPGSARASRARFGAPAEIRWTPGTQAPVRPSVPGEATATAREGACVPRSGSNRMGPDRALVLLLDAWPAPAGAALPLAQLAQLLPAAPATRILALGAGVSPFESQADETLSLVPSVDFLPDAIVLEAEWRERGTEAHHLEAWRGSVGAGVDTAEFLTAARRALYLHHHWPPEPPVRHIHAAGPGALLCAWLLHRLDPRRQASFILPAGTSAALAATLPGSTLRRLAPDFLGGWLPGAARLAAELGSNFYGDDPRSAADGWPAWQNALLHWAALPQS
jgi:glycosyltransferase involved in cell wall biosynthesis